MTAMTQGAMFSTAPLRASRASGPRRAGRVAATPVLAKGSRKAVVYDKEWKKGYFTSGYFLEQPEAGASYLASIEKNKVLSSVESLGLLSKAEAAGLSLSKMEKLGLLSTAEKLGLLETAENLLVTDPGKITALSIPALVAALGVIILVPGDGPLAIVKYGLGAVLLGVAGTFFAGGYIVATIQE